MALIPPGAADKISRTRPPAWRAVDSEIKPGKSMAFQSMSFLFLKYSKMVPIIGGFSSHDPWLTRGDWETLHQPWQNTNQYVQYDMRILPVPASLPESSADFLIAVFSRHGDSTFLSWSELLKSGDVNPFAGNDREISFLGFSSSAGWTRNGVCHGTRQEVLVLFVLRFLAWSN